jgi:MSHA biogenesis protein MshP
MNARRSGGFSLVSAIFLMVVLVILGVSLVTISSVQHTTTAQQLQAARANYATRAGAEWALTQANTGGWCAAPTETSFALPAPLDGFNVTVSCTRTDHGVGAAMQQYFVVDITATSGQYGSPDYVRRRLRTKMLGPVP